LKTFALLLFVTTVDIVTCCPATGLLGSISKIGMKISVWVASAFTKNGSKSSNDAKTGKALSNMHLPCWIVYNFIESFST
jgi:hypothetical protein